MSSAQFSGGAPRYPSTMGWSSHREKPPPHQQGGTGLPPDVQLNLDRLRMYASGSHVTREQSYGRQPHSAHLSAAPVAPSPSWATHASSGNGSGNGMAAGPGGPSTPTSPLRSSLKGSNSAAFQSGSAQAQPPPHRGFGSPAPTTPTSEDRDARPALNPADQSKDNFNAVVTFLRARYGDDDAAGSVAKLSDADVDGFLECFGQELRRSVVKARGGTTVTIATNEPVLSSSSAPRSAENGAASPARAKLPETLKEAMALLKDGTHCVKFSSRKGEPAPRFVRVQGRRALVEGEMVAVPHVCWAATEAEEATGQLSLLTLTDLETGPSVRMKRGSDGNHAAVVGPFGTPIPDRHFLTLVFEKRCLDLAFDTEGECRAWEKALWLVIGRNRRMAVGGTKQ